VEKGKGIIEPQMFLFCHIVDQWVEDCKVMNDVFDTLLIWEFPWVPWMSLVTYSFINLLGMPADF
jgi:hypothetical protein